MGYQERAQYARGIQEDGAGHTGQAAEGGHGLARTLCSGQAGFRAA